MDFPGLLDSFTKLLVALGWQNGLLAVFFVFLNWKSHQDHKALIAAVERENRRLAQENQEHRERYERLLNSQTGNRLPTESPSPQLPPGQSQAELPLPGRPRRKIVLDDED